MIIDAIISNKIDIIVEIFINVGVAIKKINDVSTFNIILFIKNLSVNFNIFYVDY